MADVKYESRRPLHEMGRGNYWFDFDDLSDADCSDALSDSCVQNAKALEVAGGTEQYPVEAIKDYINQPVDKIIHSRDRVASGEFSIELLKEEVNVSALSESKLEDGKRHGRTDINTVGEIVSDEYIATRCFFDWDSLPDLVLSQRQRGVIHEDLMAAQPEAVASGSEMPEVWLCCDSNGHPRGKCQSCQECETCVLANHSYICWEPVGELANHPLACERCNCAIADHESWSSWHSKVRDSLKRFRDTGGNTKMMRPSRSDVPVAALEWDADEVALYVLTEGEFDPRKHGRSKKLEAGSWRDEEEQRLLEEANPLVSCITPTSSTRQSFHPLLYECFRSQSYEPKELIVIETGDEPSKFLQECSRSDPRVIYRYWQVEDARMQDLSETVMEPEQRQTWNANPVLGKGTSGKGSLKGAAHWQNQQRWSQFQEHEKHRQHAVRLKEKLRGKVRGGKRKKGWTLGMKRNLACHLARGDVIAHMDDDDLYAPIYLITMVAKLQDAARYRPYNGRLAAAAATLEAWHVLDLSDQTFGFFNPKGEDLLDQAMRESFAYGFGFSYIYSKAAWDLQAFADVEWSEDGHFTTGLLERRRPVKLVNPRFLGNGIDAIAAHSHHRDTTSGGEFSEITYTEFGTNRSVTKALRMGKRVTTPKELASFLPLVRSIVHDKKLSRYDVHPVRQEVTLNPARGEIGLEQKQDFMRRYGAGLGQWPKMQPRPIWSPNAPNTGFQGKGKGKGKTAGWPWSQGMRPAASQPLRPLR